MQASTVVDGSQLSEVHVEIPDDRKRSRRDDDNAGIALRKPHQAFQDYCEDDDNGETSVGSAIVVAVMAGVIVNRYVCMYVCM